ncbi:MAG: EamA family transporter [Rhizobiaceae bacterium]|nr:EamA family transporter [Rhizobiaceae bacterium]
MKLRATMIGFSACLMWALLALFTAASGTMPPFQLNAVCFAIGALPGILLFILKPERLANLRQPAGAWATGIIGLFGYHFLYFTALRNAPAAEASMIAYLWPLFIVLGSAMLPGEKLRPVHVVGALIGFAGAALLVSGRAGGGAEEFSASQRYMGYAAALACAFTWSGYSLLSRRYGNVPTDVVTAFCIATSVLSAVCHLFLETTVWPESAGQWLAVAGLGIFPVGLAFYTWDYGVKNGDIQLLGVASYASPVLSTLALIAAGFAEPSWQVLTACLLVPGGALLAVSGTLLKKKAA